MIPGSIPIWTKGCADNQSNSGALLTAPPDALHVTEEDVYAPSIMVAGCYRSLAIQLGNNCNINSKFREKKCSIIRKDKISVRSFCNRSETANQIFEFQTLSFNIIINDEFINGQDNISVSFIQYAGHGATYNYNASGYLYFDSQPRNNFDTITESSNINNDPIQCTCTTTGDSDPKQTTDGSLQKLECQEVVSNATNLKVISGSKSISLHISGFFIMLVLFLFNADFNHSEFYIWTPPLVL